MKKLFFLLALTISLNLSFAQYAPDWVQPATDYLKTGAMIACDTSNNLIVAGYRPAFAGAAYIYTSKFDETGNLLWEQADASGVPGKYQKARWVNTDNHNNIYVTGYRYSGISNEYTDTIVVLKYNESGNLLWKKNIGHIFPSALPMRSEMDSNGNLYIGTVGISPGFQLIKLDSDGNIIFNAANASSANQSFTSMRLKNSLIVMTSYAFNGTQVSVAAFDTTGNFIWSKMFQSRGGMDVEIDDDLNCYILSRELNQVSGTSGYDIEIFKFNSIGTLLNQYNYDFDGGTEFATRMTLVNGKITIIGASIMPGSAYMDWIIFQTDLDGSKLWDARYDFTTSNDEKPSWVSAKSNGDVYVSGQGGPDTIGFNGSVYLRYVTAKYSNGEMQWVDANPYQGYIGIANAIDKNGGLYVLGEYAMTAIHYIDSNTPVSINERNPTLDDSKVNIYPNPVTTFTTIEYNLSETGNMSIFIYDILGKVVKTIPAKDYYSGTNKIRIDLSEQYSGIYFCKINAKENYDIVKIIKN